MERLARVRDLVIGKGHPISVQTMYDSPLAGSDPARIVERISSLHSLGCDLIRFSFISPEDAEPFVTVGSQVKKGQTLAIVEAMKLMNEIESDFDGKVAEVLVENGQPVEYGQPLFRIC